MSNKYVKLPKIAGVDNITKYDNESYKKNPLLLFQICKIRERRHYSFLKRSAAIVSIK